MRAVKLAVFAALTLYSLALMLVEWNLGAEAARHFVTDVVGPRDIVLYGVNTVLTTFLLWATGLLFLVRLACEPRGGTRRRFFASQVVFFAYLGFDELCLVHEQVGVALGFNDAFLLLGLGVLELLILFTWGRIVSQPMPVRVDILLAGSFFGVMILIDAVLPAEARLRLSLEDLAKFWACFFLFLFAWHTLSEKLTELYGAARALRS